MAFKRRETNFDKGSFGGCTCLFDDLMDPNWSAQQDKETTFYGYGGLKFKVWPR